ncbi:28483_t:CDS:2 [Dentiscutata erythropus]|uniref:28483_t:CDS:1 n=1 Tax=Dentiscutata erythropus TaxID=1348616 RepID=A0A9N9I3A7_9GLOM|nr:28483_t:CDS:2 [Dentiscutata erythropus]
MLQNKNSLLYEERINNKIPLLPPTASPVIPIRSISYSSVVWNDFNVKLHKTRQQQKVDSDWAAVYSIFIQFNSLSDYVGGLSFAFEEDKDQEITDLIRFSFPIEGIERSEVSRWRKVYDLVAFVKTVTKLDHFLEAIRNLNITINFIQEIDSDEFKNLVRLRINNEIPLLIPATSPNIPIKSESYNAEKWLEYNKKLQKNRQQQKVNLDWAAVYSTFIQFDLLSDHVGSLSFTFEDDRNKKINSLIRMSFQMEGVKTETSRLRKIYDLVVIVKETIKKRNISLETFLEHIRDLNITINYLQDVEPDLFKKLVNLSISKIKVN